jgi:hypothetical protein
MDQGNDSRVPLMPIGTRIPRVIHQIYITLVVPKMIEDNIANIKKLNPGWEHCLYGDREILDYIGRYYGPEMLRAYNQINPKYGAARADLFRYLLVYREGGVYLDIKSTTRRPLDEVLSENDQYILVKWQDDPSGSRVNWGRHPALDEVGEEEYQQWHILAVAGHPFLRAVILRVLDNIANYDPLINGVGKSGVLWLSGPIAYTLAIAPLASQIHCRSMRGHEQLGLVYSIYSEVRPEAHKHLFRHNYDNLRLPVANIHGTRRMRWILHRAAYFMPSFLRRAIKRVLRLRKRG